MEVSSVFFNTRIIFTNTKYTYSTWVDRFDMIILKWNVVVRGSVGFCLSSSSNYIQV